jgi:hypothetical protein
MPFDFRKRGEKLIDKLKALRTDSHRESVKELYDLLTILDSKATGLLTVDALVVAILLGVLSSSKPYLPGWGIWISLCLTMCSALLCLLIVNLPWGFLGQVYRDASNNLSFNEEVRCLANVVHDRTWFYCSAWKLAFLGITCAPVFVIIRALGAPL